MLIAAFATVVTWPHMAVAEPEPWRAVQVEGEAVIGGERGVSKPVVLGSLFGRGDTLATRASGRVVLARGGSTVTMGPTGRMAIPAGGDDGTRTRILQTLGSLLFKVEKRASQHFEVETPYLAAVVKGTTFTVSVDDEASAVHVVEGAVEVTALGSGDVGLLKPGLTAVVSPRRGSGLIIIGRQETKAGPEGRKKGEDASSAADKAERLDDDSAATPAADNGRRGRAKRLRVMLGHSDIDIAEASNGFVKRAATAGNPIGRKSSDHGKDNSEVGKPGGGNAFNSSKGDNGNGHAYGHDKHKKKGQDKNKKDKKTKKDKKEKKSKKD